MATAFSQLTSQQFLEHVISRAPRVAAFDCDGTLWAPNSGLDFMHWEIETGLLPRDVGIELLNRYKLYEAGEVSEYDMCGEMVSVHAGLPVEEIVVACKRFAAERVVPYIFPTMQELVHRLHDIGCDVWAVTSTAAWVVREALTQFEIADDHVLGVELACESGRATSELLAVPTDEHKAFALQRVGVQPQAVFGNSIHDQAMLEMAADAYAINPNPDLRRIAEARGWIVFDPQQ